MDRVFGSIVELGFRKNDAGRPSLASDMNAVTLTAWLSSKIAKAYS